MEFVYEYYTYKEKYCKDDYNKILLKDFLLFLLRYNYL